MCKVSRKGFDGVEVLAVHIGSKQLTDHLHGWMRKADKMTEKRLLAKKGISTWHRGTNMWVEIPGAPGAYDDTDEDELLPGFNRMRKVKAYHTRGGKRFLHSLAHPRLGGRRAGRDIFTDVQSDFADSWTFYRDPMH